MSKGFVYILKDEAGRFYVGSTIDIERRLGQHFAGHTPTTKRQKNSKPVLFQEYQTIEEARAVERKIKSLKRKDYIEKMVKDGKILLRP